MYNYLRFRFSAYRFPVSLIRNFCIIAHIDHGKSTLADRFLEITNTIPRGIEAQYLDKLKVYKYRGITVKAQAVSMYYNYNNTKYLINFVDTPGHVDFNYEVRRSMRSCQGALLVIDATQGIQAQTLSNFELAKDYGLKILPVLNKIDMVGCNAEYVEESVESYLGLPLDSISRVSAKTGQNVESLIKRIIEYIPPPADSADSRLKLFLVNSWYIRDKGVACLFQVKSGYLKKGTVLTSCSSGKNYQVFYIGILNPELTEKDVLTVGQVGYVLSNMKEVAEARIGDTFYKTGAKVEAEKGFEPSKPMVYAGIYPLDPDDFSALYKKYRVYYASIYKLILTDPAVTVTRESSATLGNGFRCGFLGILHMDVFKQRLDDEYEVYAILTSPSVPYKCKLKKGKEIVIDSAANAPDRGDVAYYEEPMVRGTIVIPKYFLSDIKVLCDTRRGTFIEETLIGTAMLKLENKRYILKYRLPLAEIITDFVDIIKSVTHGYGSFEYDQDGYAKSNIEKMVIHVMGDPVDSLSFMVHKDRAYVFAKQVCKKMKYTIPQQLFTVSIQAKIGTKVIAKYEIAYVKKHVTAKCYGGDYSRKKKLLDRYKEGKKKLRSIGQVQVGKETFLHILRND